MQLPLGIPLVYYYQCVSNNARYMKQSPFKTCVSLCVDEFLDDFVGLTPAVSVMKSFSLLVTDLAVLVLTEAKNSKHRWYLLGEDNSCLIMTPLVIFSVWVS